PWLAAFRVPARGPCPPRRSSGLDPGPVGGVGLEMEIVAGEFEAVVLPRDPEGPGELAGTREVGIPAAQGLGGAHEDRVRAAEPLDRKSTRLNSSHLVISYAVFCL